MAKIKKSDDCWWGYGVTGTGESVKWYRHFGKKASQFLMNLYIDILYDPAIPSVGV